MPNNAAVDEVLQAGPVIPVILIDDADKAVPLARALLEGGVRVLEVTLRTPAAMEAIRRIRGEVPGVLLGAGTVLSARQLEEVAKLDLAFAVSPGVTPALLEAADSLPLPLLPGTATASEVMVLLERGYTRMKLFPAEQVGGVSLLKALSSPLQAAKFCPTGGITVETARTYLALPNVICVGGSWLTPADAVRAGDWGRITDLARAASTLGRAPG
ncbi:MAG: bifunctional 4-hydroxy-2-oxoglutarate aldolase/2-dehydro-3-deoxy-phosphogluconate aldolase [Geminicoccaceae bacterium]